MTITSHRTAAAKSATTTARRTLTGLAVFACATGALAAAGTSADATVTGLSVSPSSSYTVDTAYTLTATCDRQTLVNFTDNGQPAGTAQPDATGAANLQWVPASPGVHVILAEGCSTSEQSYSDTQISVNVGGIGTGTQTTDPNAPGYYVPTTTSPYPATPQTTDPNAPGYYNPWATTTTTTDPNSMLESMLGQVLVQVLQGVSSAVQTQGN